MVCIAGKSSCCGGKKAHLTSAAEKFQAAGKSYKLAGSYKEAGAAGFYNILWLTSRRFAADAWSQAAECFSDAHGRVDGACNSLDAHESWKEAAESLKMQANAEDWQDQGTIRGD